MLEQIYFVERTLRENQNGQSVVKGKDASVLEQLLKSLLPIVRISNDKVLIGTIVKTVEIKS